MPAGTRWVGKCILLLSIIVANYLASSIIMHYAYIRIEYYYSNTFYVIILYARQTISFALWSQFFMPKLWVIKKQSRRKY